MANGYADDWARTRSDRGVTDALERWAIAEPALPLRASRSPPLRAAIADPPIQKASDMTTRPRHLPADERPTAVLPPPHQQTEHRPMTTHSINMICSIEELPITLTVSEAAAVLRIGRTKVYAMVGQWNLTSGAEGLRSVRLGRSLRIPRVAVLECLGIVPTAGSDIVPSTESPELPART